MYFSTPQMAIKQVTVEEKQTPLPFIKPNNDNLTEDFPTAGVSWKDLHGDDSQNEWNQEGESIESGQLSPKTESNLLGKRRRRRSSDVSDKELYQPEDLRFR